MYLFYRTLKDIGFKRVFLRIKYEIRKKIEDSPKNPKYLQTIRGEGYVLWIE